MTIPQCSQVVVGAFLTQFAGLSPTSSLRDGSMPVPRFWSLGRVPLRGVNPEARMP